MGVEERDAQRIRDLVAATGNFSTSEIAVAEELVHERLGKGVGSGYEFLLIESGHDLVGCSCYGHIPATLASYDVYWIAVAPTHQRRGLGMSLLEFTEGLIRATGGEKVYVDTSSRPDYHPARQFYERAGYCPVAVLPDFYAPNDAKIIYCKGLGPDVRINV
ncbi:MAG: GNAT family N-acetyltransferase [Gammaproteobacteria bacterium]|nr:GNAT family N-acetyltransferase [Gammaproteobacteria bacterium]